jgi:DNA polymerase-1
VQDVWDIEVEEDHSYVAQGLIHHNSSSDPNLQNVSKDSDEYQIRALFIPAPGLVLGDADQAQLEMRIVASQSRDAALIAAILEGKDLHGWTAHRMFDIPYEHIMAAVAAKEARTVMTAMQKEYAKLRGHSKQINFGVIYGETAFKLSKQLGCSMERAEELLGLYWESYPGMQRFFQGIRDYVDINGYIETPLGRRRWIHQARVRGLSDRDYARGMRQAGNHPIQGAASELIKCAQIRIYCDDNFYRGGLEQVLQVHDEIVTQAPSKFYADPENVALFEHYMAYPFGDDEAPLVVPLIAKLHTGINWSEAK